MVPRRVAEIRLSGAWKSEGSPLLGVDDSDAGEVDEVLHLVAAVEDVDRLIQGRELGGTVQDILEDGRGGPHLTVDGAVMRRG